MNPTQFGNFAWGDYDFSSRSLQLLDTSLRDGLQDAEIRHPTLQEKTEFLHRLLAVGVDAVDVGIPIARGPHLKDAIRLAKELPSEVQAVCLARTQEADLRAAVELAQGSGRSLEVILFVGSSPLRRWVEGWDLSAMSGWMEHCVALAVKEGLKPTVATEHTTETEPEVILRIFRAGLEAGARRACIADTCGVATPNSVAALLGFFRRKVLRGFPLVEIDWHGHNDRGLSLVNSMAAFEAGAARVHATVLGIGERAGNTPLETLLLNLKIAGDRKHQDLSALPALSELASRVFQVPLNASYPGLGQKVGMTASGIHAAAMLKARRLGIEAGLPYSVVDQRWFNREAEVRVGPLSGRANVEWAAEKLGILFSDALVERALAAATDMNRLLSEADLINIANSLGVQRGRHPWDPIEGGSGLGRSAKARGQRTEGITLQDGTVKRLSVLSFRERRHLRPIVDTLLADAPVAFHGWGVSGVCGRVDAESEFQKFWSLKQGRPPGSKIPLLEPPEEVVRHVDWAKVHPAFRHLQDPAALKRVWKGTVPFHLIFPYNAGGNSLSEAVVTPPFDPDVAPHTPVPTVCFFWIDDPALGRLVREVKKLGPAVQLGVSSLNDPRQTPPFSTEDLLDYLRDRSIDKYDIVVEDPIVEPLGIASSHSQFVAPLLGEEPVWVMKRRGSLSPEGFVKRTGFSVSGAESAKVAARRAAPQEDLDSALEECARRIRRWRLKAMFHWF